MLLGYSLRDMWTEAMIRDLGAAPMTYARGVVNGYTNWNCDDDKDSIRMEVLFHLMGGTLVVKGGKKPCVSKYFLIESVQAHSIPTKSS